MKRLFTTVLMGLMLCMPHMAHAEKIVKIITSFSILGDLAKQVGGDKVIVSTMIGPARNAHSYQPSGDEGKVLNVADVIIVNGLGLESWLDKLIGTSGTKAKIIVASKGVEELRAKNGPDPHAWQSVPNVMIYVANIRDGLIEADKDNEATYRANADKYIEKLRTLDAWMRVKLGMIPRDQRSFVTSHDAFVYFAREYGVTVEAIGGMNDAAMPSTARLTTLAKDMKAKNIKVAFIESVAKPEMMQKLQKQTGVTFGGKLYADALAESPPADTYEGMMRWNITAISDALK